MTDQPLSLGDRLRECGKRVGTIEKLSELSGVPRRSLEDYIAGISEMKAARLFLIAETAKVSPVWLQTGIGDMEPAKSGSDPYAVATPGSHGAQEAAIAYGDAANVAAIFEAFVFVPRYKVQLSAGRGRTNAREDGDRVLAFRRDWVTQELRVAPQRLCAVTVEGDSMEDALHDGDVVLVHEGDNEVRNGGVYAFRLDNDLFIKRLQRQPGGRIIARSDNAKLYDPFELGPDDDVSIIGRAVWSGGKL